MPGGSLRRGHLRHELPGPAVTVDEHQDAPHIDGNDPVQVGIIAVVACHRLPVAVADQSDQPQPGIEHRAPGIPARHIAVGDEAERRIGQRSFAALRIEFPEAVRAAVVGIHAVILGGDLREAGLESTRIQPADPSVGEAQRPVGIRAEVSVIFQTIEGLHEACPNHTGDWYFTGNYPTPGGARVCNRAFINFIEGRNERAY